MRSDKLSAFGARLLEAFGETRKGKIAEIMQVKPSALSNYLRGRVPSANKLKLISDFTHCSIHWLITGEGEKLVKPSINLDATLRNVVQEMIGAELESRNVAIIPAENVKHEKEKEKKILPLLNK